MPESFIPLITTEFTLKSLPIAKDIQGRLKDIARRHGLKGELTFIRKGLSLEPADVKFEPGERASVDYVSTGVMDRDFEILDPAGAILDDFQKNPVVLDCHDYSKLPVGRCAWIKPDAKGLVAKTIYANHQRAQDIYNYRKDGFPMAKSVGFIPVEWEENEKFNWNDPMASGPRRIYRKWILLEYSDVPCPSCPEALQIAISKGIVTLEQAQTFSPTEKLMPVLKPEVTENYIRIPVEDAGKFDKDSIRTITLSAEEGIKALIGRYKDSEDKKTHVLTYLFDKEKWALETAKEWVEKHKPEGKMVYCGTVKGVEQFGDCDCLWLKWNEVEPAPEVATATTVTVAPEVEKDAPVAVPAITASIPAIDLTEVKALLTQQAGQIEKLIADNVELRAAVAKRHEPEPEPEDDTLIIDIQEEVKPVFDIDIERIGKGVQAAWDEYTKSKTQTIDEAVSDTVKKLLGRVD